MEKFDLHIVLPLDCAPIYKRNTKAGQINETCKKELREKNCRNIDLWTVGSIYPKDPSTGCFLDFQTTGQLLNFVCNGHSGLLGYCQKLSQYGMYEAMKRTQVLEYLLNQTNNEKAILQENLQKQIYENTTLSSNISELKTIITDLQISNQVMLRDVENFKREISSAIAEGEVLRRKLNIRKRKRLPKKDIDDLSSRSGNKKKRIQAFK